MPGLSTSFSTRRAGWREGEPVLPARGEAATVGAIVSRVRKELVDESPLVDEIVVVDPDSTGSTAEVARQAGATVHAASDIRPDLGTRPG